MAVTVTTEAEQAQRSVTKKSESAKESALDPNGSNGGALLSDEKRERKQKKKDEDSDGRVIRKGEAVSFDIKI